MAERGEAELSSRPHPLKVAAMNRGVKTWTKRERIYSIPVIV